jgi:isopentenyl diphosphate isomerase/L-lactate dehydrogenase-like FMN-dependent dehydrogenase
MTDSRDPTADIAQRFQTTQEMIVEARRRLDDGAWAYLSGATESETSLARNRLALDSIALRPRVLRDVRNVDMSTTFLGCKLRIPVFLGPIGGLTVFDPAGALATMRAAAKFGTLSFMSSVTEPDVETVAPHIDGRLIYQLYVRGDDAWVDAYIERAIRAKTKAFCFTVDSAAYSRRERNLINRFTGQGTTRHGIASEAGRDFQAKLNWSDVARVRKKYPDLPIVIKGIGTAEDSKIALDHGVAVVYVSNHGGRQLDHSQGTMEVLPEVVEAVRGRAEVVVDGGFVRGTDVLKALALGARAVGIGKLYGWALAAAGEAGVTRMLELLETELRIDMMLLGVAKLSELDRSYVCPARPVMIPSAFSQFPSIGHELGGLKWRDGGR